MGRQRQKICLSMIVKNEAKVIERCLGSVRPFIDHWVIVDTGSSDGTQNIVKTYMNDIPGQLFERPWKDFAFNRSEALVLARPHGDYTLIIDADDVFEPPPNFSWPKLNDSAYNFEIRFSTFVYSRIQLVSNFCDWRYRGVLHEFLHMDEPHTVGQLPVGIRINSDGARREDSSTYARDVEVLEQALLYETDPLLRSRYTFYLAQSFFDTDKLEEAFSTYSRRIEMGGWEEEIWYSMHRMAVIAERLSKPFDEVASLYLRAYERRPGRAESLVELARYCRLNRKHELALLFSGYATMIKTSSDSLFMDLSAYTWRAHDEYSVALYWTGNYELSCEVCRSLLESSLTPKSELDRIEENLKYSLDRVAKKGVI